LEAAWGRLEAAMAQAIEILLQPSIILEHFLN
jgi:hypothetical protein